MDVLNAPIEKALACEQLRKAADAVWPENKLKPGAPMTQETVAALRHAAETSTEAAEFLQRLESSGYRVNSLEWHYFKYKYQYSDELSGLGELNERFDRVIADPQAQVLRSGGRLKVFSPAEGRLAIIDREGRRVTVYRPDTSVTSKMEDAQWELANLLG